MYNLIKHQLNPTWLWCTGNWLPSPRRLRTLPGTDFHWCLSNDCSGSVLCRL